MDPMSDAEMEEEAWKAVMASTQIASDTPEKERKEEQEVMSTQFDSLVSVGKSICLVPYDSSSKSVEVELESEFSEEKEGNKENEDQERVGDKSQSLFSSQGSINSKNETWNPSMEDESIRLSEDDEVQIIEDSSVPNIMADIEIVAEKEKEKEVIPETQSESLTQSQQEEIQSLFTRPTEPDMTEPQVTDECWSDLGLHLFNHNRKIVHSYGDGFCFLYAIEEALCNDHKMSMSVESMAHMIVGELADNLHEYAEGYLGEPGDLIADAIKFFESKQYRMDVVDIIVPAVSKALHIGLYIYQNNAGFIQLLKQFEGYPEKVIYLVYSVLPQTVVCEDTRHYDAAIRRSISSPTATHIFPAFDGAEFELGLESDKEQEEPSQDIPQHEHHFDFGEVEEAEEQMIERKRKRSKFPDHVFEEIIPEVVDDLPDDIDGTKAYQILCSPKHMLEKQNDQRHFIMKVSKRKGFGGRRRIGWCSGSLRCMNERCPYYKSTTTRNCSHWKKGSETQKCYCCGQKGVLLPCPARKMTEYDFKASILKVYHLNEHNCTLRLDKKKYDAQLERISQKYSHLPAMQALNEGVVEHIRAGEVEAAAMQARETANTKRFMQIHRINRQRNTEAKDSIEAVIKLKEDSDPTDTFLVYRINGENMNKDPGYTFKTSKEALAMCLEMDRTKKTVLSDQECFFDGCHSRCKNWITLAAWVYHPTPRILVRLATMEVKVERTEHVALFWQLLNEALQELTGDNTVVFNPIAFLVDEAGANHCGIMQVFGVEVATTRIFTCQSHFYHNMHNRARVIPDKRVRGEFKEGCMQLCQVTKITQYDLVMKVLWKIAEEYGSIKNFLIWWDVRKYHVFGPYRPLMMKKSNWSEMGNSGMKARLTMKRKLWLVEACEDDVAYMLQQKERISQFMAGKIPSSGKGPDQSARDEKGRKAQMKSAVDFGQMLKTPGGLAAEVEEEMDPDYFIPHKKVSTEQQKVPQSKEGTCSLPEEAEAEVEQPEDQSVEGVQSLHHSL